MVKVFIVKSTIMKNRKKNNTTFNNVIYFAGGCMWGPERFLRFIKGVINIELGYSKCKTSHANCDQITSDNQGFIETVKVTFNPDKISFNSLLDLFFKTIDSQGEDFNDNELDSHHHARIFYINDDQLALIDDVLNEAARRHRQALIIEAAPLHNFYTVSDFKQLSSSEHSVRYCHSE